MRRVSTIASLCPIFIVLSLLCTELRSSAPKETDHVPIKISSGNMAVEVLLKEQNIVNKNHALLLHVAVGSVSSVR